MTYKHLIFDLDGTLINPERGIKNSLAYSLGKMGIDFDLDNRFQEFIGPPLHVGYMQVLKLNEEEADMGVTYFREYYGSKGVYETSLYPGVFELLNELYNKEYKLYLATSKLEKYAKLLLEYLEIEPLFATVSGAAYKGVDAGKKNLILRVLDSIPETERSKCLMIGDTVFDIEGAKDTGIPSIGVLYGYGIEDELKTSGANAIVRTVEDLRKYLL